MLQDSTANSILVGEIRLTRHQDNTAAHICELPSLYHTSILCPKHKKTSTTTPVPNVQFYNLSASKSTHFYDRHASFGLGVEGYYGRYVEAESVVYLGHSKGANVQILEELEEGQWINGQTRAVLIEFTMFHVATNLFR